MGRVYLYVAGALLNAAVTAWWSFKPAVAEQEFMAINVIALALGGLALFAFERKVMRDVKSSLPPFHHV